MKQIGWLVSIGILLGGVFLVSVQIFDRMNVNKQAVQGISDVQTASPTLPDSQGGVAQTGKGFGELMQSTPTAKPSPTPTPTVKPEPFITPPPIRIDSQKKYTAIMSTSKGELEIQLFADKTPITVNNFVFLAREKFYDGTRFHRIIKGFMIQGGEAKGNKVGETKYTFADEPITGEYRRGTVAMANAGPNTNASQFFIMHQDMGLAKNYVIFGQVVRKFETIDAIAETPVTANLGGELSLPTEDVTINSIKIIEE